MIRFVFLDLDDTLLDFHRTETVAICKTLEQLMNSTPGEAVIRRYSEINDAQWKRLERGELSISQIRLVRFKLLFRELGLSISPESAQAIYERFLCEGHDLLGGALPLLKRLYGQYFLYIVSNGTPYMQEKRMADAGIGHFFERIFVSDALGAAKPQKAFFDACFSAIPQFDPTGAIILGDSLTSDMLGGINAGIKTCWFNPQRMPRRADIVPDFEIAEHDAFVEVLKTL